MAIIVSKNGKNAKKIEKSAFEQEDYLQKYIYNNPESILLYDIKEDIRLLILAREFSTSSGSIDALGVDKDGEIYLVETKLYKNPDKRLVVAQVLDYGASLWHSYTNFDEFVRVLDNEIHNKFDTSLNQRLQGFFNISDEEIAVLLDNIKNNLNEGNFRFVVLMDKLHTQLKDLIVFINENSRFDIFAVELEYYRHEDYEIMIPKLFGAEVKKDIGVSSSSGTRKKWDEKSFFENIDKEISAQQLEALRHLYDYSKDKADIVGWGTGGIVGSFSPKFSKISERSLFTLRSNGRLVLNFGWLNDNDVSKKYRDTFKTLIEEEKLFPIPQNYQTHYPEYKINEWNHKVDKFISVVDKLIKKGN